MIVVDIRYSRESFQLDASFSVPAQGVTAVFGASGAGKSTLLNLINGGLRPQTGRISLGDRCFVDTEKYFFEAAEQRVIGWVPQDSLLFPHLDVAANLDYGLRRSVRPSPVTRTQVIETLGIHSLLRRWPHQLSGGERQRVALGRALLSCPSLLLLDEPLAGLDAARKAEILALLELIKREFCIPAIHVTHSLAEVLRLADHLVLLDAGRVVASGKVSELVGRVDTPILSARADTGSLLTLQVRDHDPEGDGWTAMLDEQIVRIPKLALKTGQEVRAYVPANEVIIATQTPAGLSVRNALRSRILRMRDRGDGSVLVELAVGSQRLLAAITPAAVTALGLTPEQDVFALVKSVSLDAPAGVRLLEMS